MSKSPPQIDQEILARWKDWERRLLRKEALKQGAYNSLSMQGDLLKVKICDGLMNDGHRGVKAKIQGFSARSRMELMKKLAVWDWNKIGPAVFVTLSYPDEKAMPTRETRNKQKYLFHRTMETELAKRIPMLWRVEYLPRRTGSRRGEVVPHWHMMLPGTRFIPKEWINCWWKAAIGWDGYVMTDVRSVRNKGGAVRYISKYISKDKVTSSFIYSTYHNNAGRHWGILRDELIPKMPLTYIHRMDDVQMTFIFWYAEQFIPHVNANCPTSFTLLGLLARDAIEYMKKIGLDVPVSGP